MTDVRFFYDLGSPYAFLTAHRIDEAFDVDVPVEWVPILLGGVFKATGRSSWAETNSRADGMYEVEQRAGAYGMPFFSWPEDWPNNGLTVMRVAAWAHENNAGRRFARAAFAEQFLHGNPLSEVENIESAARRAELDPETALAGAQDPIIKAILKDNTEEAIALGVIGVPSVAVGSEVFWGDDRLIDAIAAQAATAG
ncbi:MAG: 2-hydroxychromene-2-carboxylate isomerase [Solirubrobacterales bacterium]